MSTTKQNILIKILLIVMFFNRESFTVNEDFDVVGNTNTNNIFVLVQIYRRICSILEI